MSSQAPVPSPTAHKVRIWDLPTRLFHWALVAGVVGLTITGETGGDAMVWHAWLGYAVGSLLLFRLLWGVVGGQWSRFRTFVPSPRAVGRYLRGEHRPEMRAGHSPLGALSVLALLFFLLAQVASGLFSETKEDFAGPLSAHVSNEVVRFMTGYHRNIGKPILIVLVALHIAAILYYLVRRRENLIGAMVHGDKILPTPLPSSRDDARSRTLALAVLAICAAVVTWLVLAGTGTQP